MSAKDYSAHRLGRAMYRRFLSIGLVATMAGAALAGARSTVWAEATKVGQASCEDLGQLVASHWLERKPLPLIDESLSMERALCARDRFLSLIQPLLGAPLGYKAAAITPPAQRDLGINEPLGGIYLAGMFSFENGAPVPISYGNRPIVEAKLMVAVKDDAINEAKTVEEAAKHIAFIVPSIELGDSLVDIRQKLTAPILILYNVGARAALLGSPIAFDGSDKAIQALNSLVVTTTDSSTGRQIDRQSANAMMGGPLNAVLWIIRDQHSRGVRLRAGDRLGLGALSRVRPTSGLRLETRWEGLTEAPTVVKASFE
jgi:2-keto-4-pentenoate hydratase